MMTPRERYENDPKFHGLVEVLYRQIDSANFTPSELREAVMLAAIMYEGRHVRPHIIKPK